MHVKDNKKDAQVEFCFEGFNRDKINIKDNKQNILITQGYPWRNFSSDCCSC